MEPVPCERCGEDCYTPPAHLCCVMHDVPKTGSGYCPSCKTSSYLALEQTRRAHVEYLAKLEAQKAEKDAEGSAPQGT